MSAARLTKPNHQTTRHADHPWLPVAPRVDAAVAGVIAGVVEPVAAAVAGALASPGTPPPASGARGSVTPVNLPSATPSGRSGGADPRGPAPLSCCGASVLRCCRDHQGATFTRVRATSVVPSEKSTRPR